MSAVRADVFDDQGPSTQLNELAEAARDLWLDYWRDRTREQRNRLVVYYAPLVTIVARRFAQRARSTDALEELCSFGRFGLIDAVERWDGSTGYKFATYATKRIHGAIIDELRREDFLPKRLRARVQIYHVTRDDLVAKFGRSPTIRELAAELGIEVTEAIDLRDEATSLTHLVPLAEESHAAEGRVLGASTAELSPSERAESGAMAESVKAALRRLTERQRQVLVLTFLEGMAKSEVADVLGIGRSRVTQLVQQGLENLRVQLGLTGVADAEDLLPDPAP